MAVVKLRELFLACFGEATGSRLAFNVILAKAPKVFDKRGIAGAAAEPLAVLRSNADVVKHLCRDDVRKIIDNGLHTTYLQPIIALGDASIAGYEALTRGPDGSPLSDADALFSAAKYFGLTEQLELACLQQAVSWLSKIPPPLWLSVNLGPRLFTAEPFQNYLAQDAVQALLPRVVFELTEHLPLESSFSLRASVDRLTPFS